MDFFFCFRFLLLLQIIMVKSRKIHIKSRIYPGEVATEGQFLYQGYLSYDEQKMICDGSIIHQRWALTAAHCLFNLTNPTFTVGTIYVNGSNGITYDIELSYPHSNYYEKRDQFPNVVVNDIALLRTKTDIMYTDKVSPIPLARNTTANYDYQTALMSGWGDTQNATGLVASPVLLYEYVSIMPLSDCGMAFHKLYFRYDLHMCASNVKHQQACKGDSGGPLVFQGEQIGITSQGNFACIGNYPTVYTRVSTFVPWIQAVLAEFGEHI